MRASPARSLAPPASNRISLRIAQAWLMLGACALLCLPALRGRSEWLGWLPMWCVLMPAAHIAILRWRALTALAARTLRRRPRPHASARAARSRRPRPSASARRVGERHGALLAAFLLR